MPECVVDVKFSSLWKVDKFKNVCCVSFEPILPTVTFFTVSKFSRLFLSRKLLCFSYDYLFFFQARPGNNGTNMSPALGVTLNNTAWHSCRKLIYVPRSGQKAFAVGYWPIPEAFWPDPTASSLVMKTILFSLLISPIFCNFIGGTKHAMLSHWLPF